VNVGPNLASKINTPPNTSVYDYLDQRNNNTMLLQATTKDEILKMVSNFNNKNSYDKKNNISMCLIKQVIPLIVSPLTYICNKSFEEGVFPDSMKIAKVLPLFKSGKDRELTNYRPISLLPQISKILEKLFNDRLDAFIEKYDILNEAQYGFRKNRSTSSASLELSEQITTAIDNKEYTLGVFIDLKKRSIPSIIVC
jgi:hypothetical protein